MKQAREGYKASKLYQGSLVSVFGMYSKIVDLTFANAAIPDRYFTGMGLKNSP